MFVTTTNKKLLLLSLITALLSNNVVTAQPGGFGGPPPPVSDGNPDACPEEPPEESSTCNGVGDEEVCNYYPIRNCPTLPPGLFQTFCRCAGGHFFCGHAQPCVPSYTSFPSASPSLGNAGGDDNGGGAVARAGEASNPALTEVCPTDPPKDDDICNVFPETTCNYNFFTCPDGSGTYAYFCNCVQGEFVCGKAHQCAPAKTTESPSTAPSEAPVAAAEAPPPAEEWSYRTPTWFNALKANKPDENIKKCIRMEFPPEPNAPCHSRPKTCYFGDQTCRDTASVYAATRCECASGAWTCAAEPCPGSA